MPDTMMPPAPAAPAPAAETRGEDVVQAYRLLLGRSPESEAVIAEAGRRPVPEMVAVLALSPEFGGVLDRLATGRLPRHMGLTAAELREAWAWGAAQELLPSEEEPAAGLSPGTLLGALLAAAAPVRTVLAGLPERQREALLALAAAPERSPAHLLSRPVEAEDHRCLHALLYGSAETAGEGAATAGATLAQLLAGEIGSGRFRAEVLQPLLKGERVPAGGLPAEALAACAAWLEARLGATPPAGPEGGGAFAGGLLAALLGLPAVEEWLARVHPAGHAALAAALPLLASGLAHLGAVPAAGEDVAMAYLALLGRAAESEAVGRGHEGKPLWALLRTLLGSGEFRTAVLNRLAGGGSPPHCGLAAEHRHLVAAWMAERLALPPPPPPPGREGRAPHAADLLLRLLTLPVVGAELRRLHGVLWEDARAALLAWHDAATRGPTGGIDYVTGDRVVGWALDRGAPGEPLEVEIRCNGELVGFGRADRPRPDAAGEEEAGACGFRIAWHGRSRLQPVAEGFRFRIHARRDGRPAGAEFRLDSVFTDARSTVQMLAAELAGVRGTLRRLEAMLPQLESFAAHPPEHYAAFRRQHGLAPPPEVPAQSLAVRVVLDCEAVSTRGLRRTLDSLTGQLWPHWRAVLLVASEDRRAMAAQAAARDPRFVAVEAGAGEDPDADERAAALAGEEPLVLLAPPGAVFPPASLLWLAHAAERLPGAAAFCCDEDSLVEPVRHADRHEAPVLRACFDDWTLPFANAWGELVLARRDALGAAWDAAGLLGDEGLAARRWVLWAALARQGAVAHVPRVLASVQRAEVVAEASSTPAATPPEALRPLLRHPWLLDAAAEWEAPASRITAILPTRNGAALLRDSLSSLAEKAVCPEALELLVVDNGSDEPETLDLLAAGEADGRFAVLRADEPFNWSRLNNLAVRRAARGELLLFLNDDTRMLTPGWDRVLRRLLAEPEVGAVGARLVYEDLTTQHAGVVFGAERLAAHEGVGAPMEEGGPLGRWQALRAVGAVTGAFLGCRRDAFEAAGGFDEHGFGVTFNDVDFCLRLRAAGLRVLYAPTIALVHFESKSRGLDDQDARKRERAEFEARKLVERWGDGVLLDPGFNPHWSRWNRPFTAIREPSPAEIEAHLLASAAADPWDPRQHRQPW